MTIKQVLLSKRSGVSILRFFQPDMVAHIFIPSTQETEMAISLNLSPACLQAEFQDSHFFTVWPGLKQNKENRKKKANKKGKGIEEYFFLLIHFLSKNMCNQFCFIFSYDICILIQPYILKGLHTYKRAYNCKHVCL